MNEFVIVAANCIHKKQNGTLRLSQSRLCFSTPTASDFSIPISSIQGEYFGLLCRRLLHQCFSKYQVAYFVAQFVNAAGSAKSQLRIQKSTQELFNFQFLSEIDRDTFKEELKVLMSANRPDAFMVFTHPSSPHKSSSHHRPRPRNYPWIKSNSVKACFHLIMNSANSTKISSLAGASVKKNSGNRAKYVEIN